MYLTGPEQYKVITLAGAWDIGYADGPGLSARFETPRKLLITPDNSSAVVTEKNMNTGLLRKIALDTGVVSTLIPAMSSLTNKVIGLTLPYPYDKYYMVDNPHVRSFDLTAFWGNGGDFLDSHLNPLPMHLGIEYIARSPCCDIDFSDNSVNTLSAT